MRWCWLLLLSWCALLGAQEPAGRLAALIQALASSDYSVREAATRDLVALGPAATQALQAARSQQTLEARLRIDAILATLHTLPGPAAAPFIGTRISADFRGQTIAASVVLIEKLGGVRVLLGEPTAAPEDSPDATTPTVRADNAWQQRPLSLNCLDMPLLQVLDEICLEAGLIARRGNNGEFILNVGPSMRGLAVYDGPLKLALTNISITRSVSPGAQAFASMHVQLQLEVEPGTAALGVLLPLVACTAKDDKQRILTAVPQVGQRAQVNQLGPQRQLWMNASFEPPERDAISIAELSVPLRLLLPEELSMLEVVPTRGSVAEDSSAARASLNAQGRLELSLPACDVSAPPEAGMVRRSDQVTLLDAAGQPVNARLVNSSESAAGTQQTWEGAGNTALVRVSLVRKWRIEEHTLRFKDIKLP